MLNCVTSDNINSPGIQNACFTYACWQVKQQPSAQEYAAALSIHKPPFLGSNVWILWKCCVFIVITASCLHYDSVLDCVSDEENACHLLVEALSGLWVLLFVNDSHGQQDIVFPGGLLIYFLFSFSHHSSVLTSVNYGQQIYGMGKIKPNLQIIFRASRQVQWQSWLAVIEFLAAIYSVTRRCQLQGCQLRRVLIL